MTDQIATQPLRALPSIDALLREQSMIAWRERIGGIFYGSPVRVGDRIYCISLDGDVVVLAASAEYKLLARNSLGEASQATPAIADGKMYLRTLSHLISIGGK